MLSAAIINLGCKVNKYESDAMKDKLIAAGFAVVEPEDVADIYIVNTCSVTNMAQRKSRQMLRRAKKWNPEAVVVAAGCYVNAERDVLKNENFIDIVVGNNCKKDIAEVIREYMEEKQKNDFYVDIHHTREYEEMGKLQASHLEHQRAYIKIQDGCNQFCSYCIIPYTRGRVRSRKAQHILAEIQMLAEEGVKEFVLTGIHISSYGLDFREGLAEYDEAVNEEKGKKNSGENGGVEGISSLGALVEAIAALPKVGRIRLGSLEPRIITEKFMEQISRSGKVCPHFHLSLQSACNETLKRMNRKYTIEEFEEKCRLIRAYYDRPALTTDVIVGFPGETDGEFAVTIRHLEQINFYEIHVFKYSVRAGTVAQRLPDQVDEQTKNERSDRLLALTAKQKECFERSLEGVEDEILVEEAVSEEEAAGLREFVVKEAGGIQQTAKKKCYVGHTRRYTKARLMVVEDAENRIFKGVLKEKQGKTVGLCDEF